MTGAPIGWELFYSGKVRDLYRSAAHPGLVLMVASDFADARRKAYAALETIQLEGGQYRTDIAKRVAE